MNNCKQDLEVASIEYMLRLMWGISPFLEADCAFNMPPDSVYNFLGAVISTILISVNCVPVRTVSE